MKLETERLILREFIVDDLDAFASLMADPEVMHFSLSGPMKNVTQVKEYFQKRILDHLTQYGYGLYATFYKERHLKMLFEENYSKRQAFLWQQIIQSIQ